MLCMNTIDRLAALRFCVCVLDARAREVATFAWLWRIKGDVARHLIRGLETPPRRPTFTSASWTEIVSWIVGRKTSHPNPMPPPSDAAQLTEQQKQIVRQSHPLLQISESAYCGTPRRLSGPHGIGTSPELKERVDRFVETCHRARDHGAHHGA